MLLLLLLLLVCLAGNFPVAPVEVNKGEFGIFRQAATGKHFAYKKRMGSRIVAGGHFAIEECHALGQDRVARFHGKGLQAGKAIALLAFPSGKPVGELSLALGQDRHRECMRIRDQLMCTGYFFE